MPRGDKPLATPCWHDPKNASTVHGLPVLSSPPSAAAPLEPVPHLGSGRPGLTRLPPPRPPPPSRAASPPSISSVSRNAARQSHIWPWSAIRGSSGRRARRGPGPAPRGLSPPLAPPLAPVHSHVPGISHPRFPLPLPSPRPHLRSPPLALPLPGVPLLVACHSRGVAVRLQALDHLLRPCEGRQGRGVPRRPHAADREKLRQVRFPAPGAAPSGPSGGACGGELRVGGVIPSAGRPPPPLTRRGTPSHPAHPAAVGPGQDRPRPAGRAHLARH